MKAIKILALITLGFGVHEAIRRVSTNPKREITVTNLDDEVLVSIKDGEVISHESVKVYID